MQRPVFVVFFGTADFQVATLPQQMCWGITALSLHDMRPAAAISLHHAFRHVGLDA